jgi:hypothetical protein
MTPRPRTRYPTALTAGAEHGDRAVGDGIRWLRRTTADLGGQPLLFAPVKGNLERNQLLSAEASRPGVAVATWRSPADGWRGGPVLALWPSRQKLGEIADDPRTSALCVVPGSASDVMGWVAAVNPTPLGGARLPVSEDLNPVVIEGLKTLSRSVNHANELAGSLDHRDAVAVLTLLHDGNYRLPPEAIYAWALAHGWPARGADRLRDLASAFEGGRRPRLKGANPFGPNIVTKWRQRAVEA